MSDSADLDWLKSLKAEVQVPIFLKGKEHVATRRVASVCRTDAGIAAIVMGGEGQKYSVQLAPSDAGGLASSCNCESWNKYGHCTHVVAAGLAFLARGHQVEVAGSDAALEKWLGLSALPDLEFHYRLTSASASRSERGWLIDVRRTDQPANGPVDVRRVLSASTRIAPADERVLERLAEHEVRADAKVALNDESLAELFELMSARRIIYRGTTLHFPSEPAQLLIHLRVAAARLELALPDASLVPFEQAVILCGRRNWVLSGQNAFLIQPELPTRLIRKWQVEPSMPVPPAEQERVCSFLAARLPPFEPGSQVAFLLAPNDTRVAAALGLKKLEQWLELSPVRALHFELTRSSTTGGWRIDVRAEDKQHLASGLPLAPGDERLLVQLADGALNDEALAGLLDLVRTRQVSYRGAALRFSSEPARPGIRLRNGPGGAVARIELAMPDPSSRPEDDVVMLYGRRSWALSGQEVSLIAPDFPSRLVRHWLLGAPLSFATAQLDGVLSFFAAHLPRFQLSLQADGLELDATTAPGFVLTVEGRADCVKARLVAHYSKSVSAPVSPRSTHLGYASAAADEGGTRFLRQEVAERGAAQHLVERGFRYDPKSSSFELSGETAISFWALGRNELPREWEIVAASPPPVILRPSLAPKLRVSMSSASWFELEAEFTSGDQRVGLGSLRTFLNTKRKLMPLEDGSFAAVDGEALGRVVAALEEVDALSGKTRVPLFHAAGLDALTALGKVDLDVQARRALAELREIDDLEPVKAPSGLQADLRPYQEAGLAWLWFLYRRGLSGVLADDMGLGKTMQTLALLLKIKRERGTVSGLLVAPTSVLANWERELQRFTPELTFFTWHGSDRRDNLAKLKNVDLVLTSYALIRRDLGVFKTLPFRTVILDEAQNIKNAGSATAQACKAVEAAHRIALTGTPLENRLGELWSLFDFLMPGFLGTSRRFHQRYEQPTPAQSSSGSERLKTRIHPFILRRLKTEVARDLPPRTEVVTWVEMNSGQQALYREVLKESRRRVFDSIDSIGFNKSRLSILAALMKLRQVCCEPRLLKLPPGTALPPSAKLERVSELVDELVREGHRALVFSQFTGMLGLLTAQADEKRLGYLYLDGRTKDRMAKVDAFNDPAGPPVFFISLKAGGTGLNLTAADYVIHYDPWWNPAVEDQATDRSHRIGQTRAVFSYKLITRGTVEEKILGMQQRKRELAAGVLGTNQEPGKSLTEREVEDLFKFEH